MATNETLGDSVSPTSQKSTTIITQRAEGNQDTYHSCKNFS